MRFLIVCAAAALAACQPGAQFIALDAQTAAAVATAAGLTTDAQCWQAYAGIAGVLGPPAPAPAPTTGILTVVEVKRAIQATMESPMCISVTAQLAGELLKISSPQGAAISTQLGF
jgi:hypothetical protein